MPIYNNPEFHWTFTDTFKSWDISQNPSDIFLESDTSNFYFTITSFAQQGFLIRGIYEGSWQAPFGYNPTTEEKRILLRVSTLWAHPNNNTFSFILFNGNFISSQKDYVLNNHTFKIILNFTSVSILSYRKRYLCFKKDDSTYAIIKPNNWRITTFKDIDFFIFTTLNSSLYINEIYSIIPEEWVYYDKTGTKPTVIDSIEKYPVYKYVLNNEIFYHITESTTIDWPTNSTNHAILRSSGSHFFFNSINELQKRFFIASANQIPEITDSQNYSKTINTNNSDDDSVYKIQDNDTWVLEKKNKYNKKVSIKGPPYKYFNTSNPIYTDLWDNNEPPTVQNPIIVYDNISKLKDTRTQTNFTLQDIKTNIFWIDSFTLFVYDKIYYIPKNWTVSILQTNASSLQLIQKGKWEVNSEVYSTWDKSRATAIRYQDPIEVKVINDKQSFSLEYNNIWSVDSDANTYCWKNIEHFFMISDIFTIDNSYNKEISYGAGNKNASSRINWVNPLTIKVDYNAFLPKCINTYWENITNSENVNHSTWPLTHQTNIALYKYTQYAKYDDPVKIYSYFGNYPILNQYNGLFNPTWEPLLLIRDSKQTVTMGDYSYEYQWGEVADASSWFSDWYSGAFVDADLRFDKANPNGYCVIMYDKDYSYMTCNLSYRGYESTSQGKLNNVSFWWKDSKNPPLSITINSYTAGNIGTIFTIPAVNTGENIVKIQWTETLSEEITIILLATTLPGDYHWEYYR